MLLNCLIEVFLAKFFDKNFKNQTLFIKNGIKYAFFGPLCQSLPDLVT